MKNVIYINAGAGSGKTTRLTEILSDTLRKGDVKPSEVILTTFTEMAAAEFRQRARQKLYQSGQPDIANQLDAATIGTVHSVALGFIKKYWYLAGVSPDMKVMSEDDLQVYISQSLGDYVTDEDLEFFTEYCEYFDIDEPLFWQGELLAVIEKINHYDVDIERCIKKSEEVISTFFSEGGALNHELFQEFQEILTAQIQTYDEKKETLKKNAKKFLTDKPNYHVLLDLYKEISGTTFLDAAGRLTPIVTQMGDHFPKLVDNIKATLLSSESAEEWTSPASMMTKMVHVIFRIATDWNNGFKAFKDSRHILDYNDMEEKFLRLLDSEEVCNEIKEDYKLMMVDEFQDSSPIQLEIFKKLSDLMTMSYWVGDPKQSIYGFRGADVSLVNDLIKVFDDEGERAANGLILADPLPYSYRSRKKLVGLVNDCFSRAFNGIIDRERVVLTPTREDKEGLSESLSHWNSSGNLIQNATFINKTADRIKILLDSHLKVMSKNGAVRDIEPRDIAILCFRNSECKQHAKALAARGIPVSFVNDDISQQIEVHLLISLLQLAVDASNKHVWANLLRLLCDKPTTDILNSRLDYLCQQNKAIQSEEKPEDAKLPDEWMDAEPLFGRLTAFVKAGRNFSVSDLVESIVYGLSLPEVVAKWGEKEVRQQDLSTVCALARQYDSHCQQMGIGASVGGFITYLSYAKFEPKVDNSSDAVKVLTYHKAKGLEWNYVILDSLYDDKLKDGSFALKNYWGVREMRLEEEGRYVIQYLPRILHNIGTKSTLPSLFLDQAINMPSYKMIKARETNQLRHLLYVGMTRARDYLTTLGRCSNAASNRNVPTACWIKDAGISEGVVNQTMAALWGVENLEGNIEDITGIPEADTSKAAEYTCYAYPELTITEREPKFLSPSKLPEVDVPQEDVTILADLECRIQPYRTDSQNEAAAGTCIHNIFAVFNPDLSHDKNVVNATRICNGNNMYDAIPDPGKVVTSIERLYAWLEREYGRPCAVRHEVPFVHPVGGQVIHGEMDLLWYLSEGECVLIDFKNFPGDKATITTPGETNEHYAGKYAAQLRAYRDALTASGLQVRDTLLYYSVMGCVVRLV